MGTHKNRKTKPGGRAAAVVAGCLCQTATTITGKLKKRTKAKREAAANAPNEAGAPTSQQRSHSVQADPLSFATALTARPTYLPRSQQTKRKPTKI